MQASVAGKLDGLYDTLAAIGPVAVAVSGGVDSLTLACAAHQRLGAAAVMFHAVSPAVPPEATDRTLRHAADRGWELRVIDAGEFADPGYRANPVNRCFYCKSHLYGAISRVSNATIVSGTNLDDLGDYRPGLEAAGQHGVRHPFVEAHIDKRLVRSIARSLGLDEAAELPASPCLSSRVETGIPVESGTLALVHAVESLVRRELGNVTVRCRVRRGGLVLELDAPSHARLAAADCAVLRDRIEALGRSRGYPAGVQFAPYRMGSAFLRQ